MQEILLPEFDTPEALEPTMRLIQAAITQWLDEEWTPLPEHKQLGEAAANVWQYLLLYSNTFFFFSDCHVSQHPPTHPHLVFSPHPPVL